jgi:biopolymer transport protein ExbD
MDLSFLDAGEDEALTASINTTPLVDVMLVLLIIFMITVPVVVHTVPVALPHEVDQPTITKPQTIVIAIDRLGNTYWSDSEVNDDNVLLARLRQRATDGPQPEIQIRADKDVRYEFVGRVVSDCRLAGIAKIAFIVEPARSRGVAATE